MYIDSYRAEDRQAVVELSLRAWVPVFEKMQPAVPDYVFRAFYPNGWQTRQAAEISAFLDKESDRVLVAREGESISGWIGLRLHPADNMGEIYILAVDPASQRSGVARALISAGLSRLQEAGKTMAMVETGDDPGHAPSRAVYECAGFERWPVARYFREL